MTLRHTLSITVSITALLAVALFASACGSEDPSTASPSPATTTATVNPDDPAIGPVGGGETEVTVTMGSPKNEFAMVNSVSAAPNGEVALAITNKGKIEHEFVLLKTERKAATLEPRTENPLKVIEPGFYVEAEDVAPGQTVKIKLPLPAGHYVFVCNKDGHATKGKMFADFDVS